MFQRAAGGGKAVQEATGNGLLRASGNFSMQAGEDTPLPKSAYFVCVERVRKYQAGWHRRSLHSCPCSICLIAEIRVFLFAEKSEKRKFSVILRINAHSSCISDRESDNIF